MKRHLKYLPLALLFLACDNNLVPRADYDAVLSRADSLEARCDSLKFEISDLKHYNDYLEAKLDSCETLEE